jgi:hypothetical protein
MKSSPNKLFGGDWGYSFLKNKTQRYSYKLYLGVVRMSFTSYYAVKKVGCNVYVPLKI